MEDKLSPEKFLEITHLLGKLKDTLRHCYTPSGRRESVGEHTCRIAQMALFLEGQIPDVHVDRVVRMCLVHDLGEIFTGDIPCFKKVPEDVAREDALLRAFFGELPASLKDAFSGLLDEIEENATPDAKLFRALDGLEGVVAHNESDLSTWGENEYGLTLRYGVEDCAFSPATAEIREAVRKETFTKIQEKKP